MKILEDKDGNKVVSIGSEKYVFKKPTGATLRMITNNYGKQANGDMIISILASLCISHGIDATWFDNLDYDTAKEVLTIMDTFQLK